MEIYLVVIDTTTMPDTIHNTDMSMQTSVRSRSLSKGIQNFYFIYAPNAEKAKGMVVATFRSKPTVMNEVNRCITATPLNQITRLLNERSNTWSYIPIGGVRAAGQQRNNNTLQQIEQMHKNASSENAVSHKNWQPPKPITYDAQADIDLKDVGNLTAEERKLLASKPMSEQQQPQMPANMNMNNMTPEQQQQMFAMFMQMMNNGGQAPVQKTPTPVQQVDPQDDADLQQRIRANMAGPTFDHENENEDVDTTITPEEAAEIERVDNIMKETNQDISPASKPQGWEDDLNSVSADDTYIPPPEDDDV